jgi:hypothetical protein
MEQSLWGHQSCYGWVNFWTQWVGDVVIKESKLSGNGVKIPVWQRQALGRRPLTAWPEVLSHTSPLGICGRRSSAGTVFSASTSVWPPSHFTHLRLASCGDVQCITTAVSGFFLWFLVEITVKTSQISSDFALILNQMLLKISRTYCALLDSDAV